MSELKNSGMSRFKSAIRRMEAVKLIDVEDRENFKIHVQPTPSTIINAMTGIGGLPRGKLVEIFGPNGCTSSETFINYEVWSADGKIRRNKKGGTIERLYERFTGDESQGIKQGRHLQNNDSLYYVISVDKDGNLLRNLVTDVHKTGTKICYEVTTSSGLKINTTKDHKFLTDDGEYKALEELSVGDNLYVKPGTKKKDNPYRKEVLVKYHPNRPKKTVNGYEYYRLKEYHLVYEAWLNGMDISEYKNALNTFDIEEINKFKFITEGMSIHHIDGNYGNNSLDNLELVDNKQHTSKHHKGVPKLNFKQVLADNIVSIKEVGYKDTYDISCLYPNNNYLANNIVVHNCGKSTFSIQTAAKCLQDDPDARVLYMDLEQTMDLSYAERLGVPMVNSRLDLIQAAYGEEASKLILCSLEESLHDLIIIDSLSTMNTKSYLDSETNQIGQRAKLSTELLHKMLAAMLNNEKKPTVILINQVRTKIDISNPRATKIGSTSTHAMDHYVVMRFQLRQQESSLKDGKKFDYKKQLQTRFDTYRIRVSLIKNKYGGRKDIEGTFFIDEGNGINDARSVVEMAVERYCTNKGAWYSYEGLSESTSINQAHGKESLIETILNTPVIYEELKERILEDIDESPSYSEPFMDYEDLGQSPIGMTSIENAGNTDPEYEV